jgi:hypothetical protein
MYDSVQSWLGKSSERPEAAGRIAESTGRIRKR